MSTTPTEPTTAAPAAPATPAAAAAAPAPQTPAPAEPTTYTAPATQADLDRIIADRLSREKAKYADYDAVKTKAAEYDKAQDAAKTELQREKERADKAVAEALVAKREAFAAGKGVPAAMISGSTPEEWEKAAAAALDWKGTQVTPATTPPATTAHAAGNNGAPAGAPGDIDAQIAEAEKARNFSLAIALKQRKFAAQSTTRSS